MSFVIDGILVTVMIFCVIFYSKKGFVASLVGFVRFWLAAGLAIWLSGPVANKLQPVVEAKLGISQNEGFFSVIVERIVSSGYLSRVLAFALIFVAALIAVKLLELLLKLLVKLPVVSFFNKTLGAVMGIAIGLFWLQVLSLVFMMLAEYLSGSVSWITHDAFDNTYLAKFIYDNNLFRYLFERLTSGIKGGA